ncbi:hypothetical protein BAnh1_02270 [Bartonella australis AUST/NH1]|uniref:Uncharacterized protein n=1 Tax=Bartonella australis (strain Aust/NH1) TaxID=1094489 RepID=M1N2H8_BARAA|nr:hypothetical protein [Bartonella australis]AGF74114.1 hypothetical protein BAnh1_02270 [Bartonella australis AUST/NH1]
MYQLIFTLNGEKLEDIPVAVSFEDIDNLQQIIKELPELLADDQFYHIDHFSLRDILKLKTTSYTEDVAWLWILEENSRGRYIGENSVVPKFVEDSDVWREYLEEGKDYDIESRFL